MAKMLGLNTSTLRFWEKEFPQLAQGRPENGQRRYTEEQLALLREIQRLLHEQGMTIQGARRLLDSGVTLTEAKASMPPSVQDEAFRAMLLDELLEIRKLLANAASE